MNLGQAKTILIIAFAGLNLFLAYQLFWPHFGRLTSPAVTAEDLRVTEAMLADHNFILEARIERATQTSDFLTVSPDQERQKEIIGRLIGQGAKFERQQVESYYRLENGKAVLHGSGRLQLFFDPGLSLTELPGIYEHQELIDKTRARLIETGIWPEEAQFDYLEESEDGLIILHFQQVMGGRPIFANQLRVFLDPDGIIACELNWLKLVERYPQREMEVISAAEALNNLVRIVGSSSETRQVHEVSLGYLGGEYDAEKWEIPPVWRIELDSGYYYINAFTGNLEQESIIPEEISAAENISPGGDQILLGP